MLYSLFRVDIETIFKGLEKLEPEASEEEKTLIKGLREKLSSGLEYNDPKQV